MALLAVAEIWVKLIQMQQADCQSDSTQQYRHLMYNINSSNNKV